MSEAARTGCPMHDNVDRRKSAPLAIANTKPDAGAHWVKNPLLGRAILRNKTATQAGAGADMLRYKNPEQMPVFFLDGEEHAKKRRKTLRFLSPKAISDQHYKVMEQKSRQLLDQFQKEGRGVLEDISFDLAIEVVGEIIGLTESDQHGRAKRIQNVLGASISKASNFPLSAFWLNLRRAFHTGIFFWFDVRPAMAARRENPKDDAITFFIEEGYSNAAIIVDCLTYGTAGMITTREFIVMAAWYLFENPDLRERFLQGDPQDQLAVLMEILRLEPVAAMIHRRVGEPVEGVADEPLPAGEKYGIDIRASNTDETLVGECPFAIDPDRAKRMKENGRYLSFGDGPHACPGWQVALHETRIFLTMLFQVPGLKLEREPDIGWNSQVMGYELRNAIITCDKTA